ncbi:MAG TPA: hypothetical protein VMY42_11575, partial [Thermoguttaceae bacterium]|nr:hypothetical protein [Thermoguttaceae bacterium]
GLAPSRKWRENRRATLPARCLSPFSTGFPQHRPKREELQIVNCKLQIEKWGKRTPRRKLKTDN